MKCSINSIFRATEGEGTRLGTPQIFVRFQGCNVGCVNCDTMESWEFGEKYHQDIEDVLDQIREISRLSGNLMNASITGGDPLHPKNVPGALEVARRLKSEGYFISLEAAGTRVVDSIFDVIDFISFDYKTISTGVRTNPELIVKLIDQYYGKFQLKTVIVNNQDFEDTLRVYESIKATRPGKHFPWCLTPSYEAGEEFPRERFLNVVKLNEQTCGKFLVVGQQHKWLHGPDVQDV